MTLRKSTEGQPMPMLGQLVYTLCQLVVAQRGCILLPTVAEVLAMPAVQAGRPGVLVGGDLLNREVRWVHVSELEDIAGLLQGGELILTTGIALPDSAAALRRYVNALAAARTSGLLIELGRRFDEVPPVVVTACTRHGLPLVALSREVEFVRITEAIHARILQEQFAALRTAERAHDIFTALCVDGSSVVEIVRELARMVGAPVIFEDLMHRVLAYEASGVPVDDLLRNWESRSRAAAATGRGGVCGLEEWAVTSVEVHGEVFGRLIVIPGAAVTPTQMMVLERAATALTLNRLLERNRETVERQAQRSTLDDVIEQRYATEREMHARTAALGVPTARRLLVAVVVQLVPARTSGRGRVNRDTSGGDMVSAAARAAGIPSLVATLPDGTIGVLVTISRAAEKDSMLRGLAEHIHQRAGGRARALVGVGSMVRLLQDVARSFSEARQVAMAARASSAEKPYYELPDIRLRGLIYTLADDPRLHAFVERTLGPLLQYDDRNGTDLLGALRAYVGNRGNKSMAARAAHMSRQAFYERLATIERVLLVDLESAEVCTSLHAALMGLESESER